MNILSLFYKDKKGGFNKRLYMMCEAFAKKGHRVYYLSSERFSVSHQNIMPVILNVRFRNPYLFWASFTVKSMIKCLWLVRKKGIGLVVTFGPFYTLLCVLPIVFNRTRAVTFLRADNLKQSTNILRNAFFYLADWLGIKLSDKILVVSSALKRTYRERYGISATKIDVQPNNIENKLAINIDEGVTVRQSLGVRSGEFLITTSGVFNEGKNFSYLIRAIWHVKKQNVKVAIIGDEVTPTGERRKLEELVKQLCLQDQIIFCGWQDNPARLIAGSDLFAYPSKFEGSPNALLEALGCLIPCLGSRIEEIAEILTYDELLFPLADERVLAEKILRASSDTVYYAHLRDLSLKCAEASFFDWGDETIRKILAD